jgi:hypothetical protein
VAALAPTTPKSPLTASVRAIVVRIGNFMGISFGVCRGSELFVGVARRFHEVWALQRTTWRVVTVVAFGGEYDTTWYQFRVARPRLTLAA